MRPACTITVLAAISFFILTAAAAPGAPAGGLGDQHAALSFAHMTYRLVLPKFSGAFTPGTRFWGKLNKRRYHDNLRELVFDVCGGYAG